MGKPKRNVQNEIDGIKKTWKVEQDGFQHQLSSLEALLRQDPVETEDVEDEYEQLTVSEEELQLIADKLVAVLTADDEEDEALETKRRYLEINKQYRKLKRQCQKLGIGKEEDGNNATATIVTPKNEAFRCKLPKRELPSYGGDVREWQKYWAEFRSIHEDSSIPDSEKLHYLIQSTVEDSVARTLIKSIPENGGSYKDAVTRLTERFGSEKVLFKVCVRDLLKIVSENTQVSKLTSDFEILVYTLETKIKNLEKMKISKTGEWIYAVLESCIPEDVLQSYLKTPGKKEDSEDLIKFLKAEVGRRNECRYASGAFQTETSSSQKENNDFRSNQSESSGTKARTPTATGFMNASSETQECMFCGRTGHMASECRKVSSMTIESRIEALKRRNGCFKCLKPRNKEFHKGNFCKTNVNCTNCGKKHHVMMCREFLLRKNKVSEGASSETRQHQVREPVTPKNMTDTPQTSAAMKNYISRPEVVLQTLMVDIHSPNGTKMRARAMYDNGSQSSCILESLAKKIDLAYMGTEKVNHLLFGGQTTGEQVHDVYKLFVSEADASFTYNFNVSAVKTISAPINSAPRGPWVDECMSKGIHISDLNPVATPIELLIGADVGGKLKAGLKSLVLDSGPVAVQTLLGWVLEGKLPESFTPKRNPTLASMCINMHVTDQDVSNLWSLEAIGITDNAETKTRREMEESAQKFFEETVHHDSENKRYVVNLPWIEGHPKLLSNKAVAVKRLEAATRTLLKDGKLQDYDHLLKNWKEDGIIEAVPLLSYSEKSPAPKVHYLPHRAVYKENSTTPIRPVFDASAKTKSTPSLNDCLEKGPNLLELIPNIMTRFRLEKIGVTADIKKAFLQMKVAEGDRDSLRFLWWEDINNRKKLIELRHTRVVFGVSASPFLLGATLNHHLNKSEVYSENATKLKKSFYVDNCLTSLPTMKEAETFESESRQLLTEAGFDLRGWEYGPCKEGKDVQVLGMTWNTGSDTLTYDFSSDLLRKNCSEKSYTKRKVLSVTNAVFDPLGLVSPFTLVAKLILKKLCTDDKKIGWDTEISEQLQQEFTEWLKQTSKLRELQIPRCIIGIFGVASKPDNWSLHVFCDASKNAYATCIYLRIDEVPVRINLVQAKARVSPKQIVTIPRLELLACLIGSCLSNTAKEAIEFEEIPATYWTDSSTALTWIQTDTVWASFVNNRVNRIRKKTDQNAWRHVPGKMNPADLASRGCTLEKLETCDWFNGPEWLYEPASNWPSCSENADADEVNSEKRKTVVTAVCTVQEHFITRFTDTNDYNKIIRRISCVIRFISNLKLAVEKKRNRRLRKTRCSENQLTFTIEEIQKAEIELFKFIQRDMIIPPKLVTTVDEDGLYRVTTSLTRSEWNLFTLPILLPGKHLFVHRLILNEHELNCHAGVQYMQGILREKFWITKNRRNIRNVIHGCVKCKRHLATRCQVSEAPLPTARTQTVKAFQTTGVDLAGPLYVESGRKVWIVMFTCAVYRAVHLELVPSLSTEAFISVLRKFVARRGRPETIYSDNGTNFVGASNAMKSIKWNEVLRYSTVQRITWRFNPPTAAWWGGWWERLIGLMKQLLRKMLGNRSVKFSELEVLLTEVEAVMNERPLTYVSEDQSDLKPLKPSMFLRDLQANGLPEMDVVDHKHLNARLKHLQKLREDLRNRFRSEYLSQLVQNKRKESPALKEGDVVLMEVDNKKRTDWPIGRVIQVYPDAESKVRLVKVKTSSGEFDRPVQRLFPLEIRQESTQELPFSEQVDDGDEPVITRSGRVVKKPKRFGVDD